MVFLYWYSYRMPRPTATAEQRQHGAALGRAIAGHRSAAGHSAEHIAGEANVSVETIRRIEQGRVANPGIFTVASIARTLGVDLSQLAAEGLRRRRGPRP